MLNLCLYRGSLPENTAERQLRFGLKSCPKISEKYYMSYKIQRCWCRLVIEIINRPDLIVLCPAVIQTGLRKPWLILGRINYQAFRLIHYRRVTTTCQKNDGISLIGLRLQC